MHLCDAQSQVLLHHLYAHLLRRISWAIVVITIGHHLVAGATCRGAETRLHPPEAKAIADRYVAGVNQLRDYLDGIQVEGDASYETASQALPKNDAKRQVQLTYYISDKKIKAMSSATESNKPETLEKYVYIFKDHMSYSAIAKSNNKYSLLQRGQGVSISEQKQNYEIYKFSHCPIALSTFYIPDLLSSPDFKFRIKDVDELVNNGEASLYKLYIDFEFIPSKLLYAGWLVVDPRRYWAVKTYEIANDFRGSRKTISGTVTYSSAMDSLPQPSLISLVSDTTYTVPESAKTKKVKPGTYSLKIFERMSFHRYDYKKTPDSEFSLASIGLASAEFPPGELTNNYISYILAAASIVFLISGALISYYLKRSSARRLSDGA